MYRGVSLISVLVLGCGRIGFDELVTVDEARGTLSVGSGFACTLRGTEVWCWGESSGGQLGVGVLDFSTTPVEVTGVPDPVSLSAGDQHVCAVTGAGPSAVGWVHSPHRT